MADLFYLGYSDYLPRSHTRLTCVAKSVAGKWQRSGDLTAELPPVGKVFAVSLPWIQLNQPVAITTAQNRISVTDEDKDRLIVDQATRLRQVVDFRKRGIEAARAALLEEGVVRVAPYSSELIMAISDTQCAVVVLSEHPVSGRLVAPSGAIKLFGLNPEIFEGDQFDDQFLEVPRVTVGEFQEEIHWQMDQDLLDTALKRLKKFDEEGPSRSERERIISLLIRAVALASENPDWHSLKDWLESYVSRVQSPLNSAEEIATALSKLAPVRDELNLIRERAFETLRNELEPVVRAEIESDLSELYDKWDRVEGELEAEKSKLDETLHEQKDASKTLNELQSQLFAEIGLLNGVLGDASEPESQDFENLVERFKHALGSSGALIQPVNQSLPPWARVNHSIAPQTIVFREFIERLSADTRRIGLGADDLSAMDIALRSGAITILPQAAAEVLVPAYAIAATGGEFVRQPLGPSILSLDDLWNDPVRGVLTAFAHGWNAALKNSERFYLVWLDGLQRTPMDVWLPSLAGVLASQGRPQNLLLVASLDAPLLDRDRVCSNLHKIAIPLAPVLTGLRPANFLTSINNATPKGTFLRAKQLITINSAEFLDYLDDIQEREEGCMSLGAGLYKAAGAYTDESRSTGEVLKRTRVPFSSGHNWLKDLFES